MIKQEINQKWMEMVSVVVFIVLSLSLFFMIFWHFNILSIDNQEQLAVLNIQKYEEKIIEIKPKRGQIYSDNGSLLATTTIHYNVSFDPMRYKKEERFNNDVKVIADSLSSILGMNSFQIFNKIKQAREKNKSNVEIAKNISYDKYLKIIKIPILLNDKKELKSRYLTGLKLDKTFKRIYPLGEVSGRLVGKFRTDGVSPGIEGAFDQYLAGKSGKQRAQIIYKGNYRPVESGYIEQPEDGYDVHATIDMNIQSVTYDVLQKQLDKYQAEHGCAIVMDVQSGEIKGISNLARGKDGKYSEALNYAIGHTYNPGSTFKPISLIALLEDAKIDTTYTINTKANLKFYKKSVSDSNGKGYGNISLAKGIVVSSNTAITQATYNLYHKDTERFKNKLLSYRVDKTLELPFQGEGTPKFSKPWVGSYVWLSYGYEIEMTPLQILTYYNTFANDGVMVKPRLVSRITQNEQLKQEFPKQVISSNLWSKDTNRKICKILENVVKDRSGTARKMYMKNLPIAGKTGTSQIRDKKGKTVGYVASFVGYFPVENPKYSCIMLIYKPKKELGYYGGVVAGDGVKEIAQRIYHENAIVNEVSLPLQAIRKEQKIIKMEKEVDKTLVPNVVGLSLMDAIPILEKRNLKVSILGRGKVVSQSIPAGQKIGKNTKITLTLK